jgi:hypothetical protein
MSKFGGEYRFIYDPEKPGKFGIEYGRREPKSCQDVPSLLNDPTVSRAHEVCPFCRMSFIEHLWQDAFGVGAFAR